MVAYGGLACQGIVGRVVDEGTHGVGRHVVWRIGCEQWQEAVYVVDPDIHQRS